MPVHSNIFAPDFDQQLCACINAISQDDATGEVLTFERIDSHLNVQQLDVPNEADLLIRQLNRYEIVLFDGGNTHGAPWKHVFFPHQRAHYFFYET